MVPEGALSLNGALRPAASTATGKRNINACHSFPPCPGQDFSSAGKQSEKLPTSNQSVACAKLL